MKRWSSGGSLALAGAIVLVAGCGSGNGSDAGASDAALDAGGTDAGTDAGQGAACDFPPPDVGGTPEGDALANAPARCGQPAHTWLRDPGLGEVLDYGPTSGFTTGLLMITANLAGIALPRPPMYDVSIQRFTYQTQDRGTLLPATAAVAFPVALPAGAPPADILLLLHGTMGFTDGCSASTDPAMQFLAAVYASQGHVVVFPDYIGLAAPPTTTGFLHPYLVGQATAIASLDAVRAVGAMDPAMLDDLCVAPRYVVTGISQGGHATFWVDRLAPYYAPELTLLGAIATVPATDTIAHGERALTSVNDVTGFFVAAAGATAPWYGFDAQLDQIFVPPYDVDVPAALATSCDPGSTLNLGSLTLQDIFQQPLLDAAAMGALETFGDFGCVLAESGLDSTSIGYLGPTTDPSYGILMVIGEVDSLIDASIERAALPGLCAQGMPIQFLECAGAGHSEAAQWTLLETLDFAEARMAGEALDPATLCSVTPPTMCSGAP